MLKFLSRAASWFGFLNSKTSSAHHTGLNMSPIEFQRTIDFEHAEKKVHIEKLRDELKHASGERPIVHALQAKLQTAEREFSILDQKLATPGRAYQIHEAETDWLCRNLHEVASNLPDDFLPESALSRILNHLSHGDLQQAEELLSDIIPKADISHRARLAYLCGRIAHFRLHLADAHGYFLNAVTLEPNNWTYLTRAGVTAAEMEDYRTANKLLCRAAELALQDDGMRLKVGSISLNNLALLYKKSGHPEEAEQCYKRALAGLEANLGTTHPALAIIKLNFANLKQSRDDFLEAEALYKEAIDIQGCVYGENSPILVKSLNNFGTLYHHRKFYTNADKFYRQALKIQEQKFGVDHSEVDIPLSNLAETQLCLGYKSEAELLFIRLIKLRQSIHGTNHIALIRPLVGLTKVYNATQHYQAAQDLCLRVIQIFESSYTKYTDEENLHNGSAVEAPSSDLAHYIYSIDNLALLHRRGKRYEESERFLKQSCRLSKQIDDLQSLVKGLNNLAKLYKIMGRHKDAKQILQKTIGILKQSHPEDHPNILVVKNSLKKITQKLEASPTLSRSL